MPTMYPVKLIEVMGRDAGWVAAASSLGKRSPEDAPHLIYPPERPLSPERLLKDIQTVYDRLGLAVAVVAETVRDTTGRPFVDPELSTEKDPFGHQLIRGTVESMARLIQGELGLRARYDKPGSLQRMSAFCSSPVDREEAAEVGRAAVRLAAQGDSDRMVTLVRDCDDPYRSHTDSVPLADVANRQRLLPPGFLTADGRDTTDAFRRYAFPLLGPDPLPQYPRLRAPRVK
jgi:6-phosphofructokinase 1